jgi:hypothetical protein
MHRRERQEPPGETLNVSKQLRTVDRGALAGGRTLLTPVICGVLLRLFGVKEQPDIGSLDTFTNPVTADTIWNISCLAAIDFGGVPGISLLGVVVSGADHQRASPAAALDGFPSSQ